MLHELEALEREALAGLHAAADPLLKSKLGLAMTPIGGAWASIAAALPAGAIVVNRAIGLGLDGPTCRDGVVDLVGAYRTAGVPRFFVHRHGATEPDAAPQWLAAEGLRPARGWMTFVRGREAAVPARPHPFAVRRIGRQEGAAFARIVCAAYDLGPDAEPWLARLPAAPGFHAFLTTLDGEPAGTGAFYVAGDQAWLDWAATAPRFRGRGSQSALLAARIAAALDLGCTTLVTCTGTAVPGDPQHSYGNLLRAGFREKGLRENWAPLRR